jgi:hypothetical protein
MATFSSVLANECNDKKQFSKTVQAVGGEYIAKKLKYPGDMDSLTKDLTLPTIPKPEELDPEETNLLVKAIWNKKITSYCTRTDYLDSNLKTAYAVIWGQYSEAIAYTQGPDATIAIYLEHFTSLVEVWNITAAPLAKIWEYSILLMPHRRMRRIAPKLRLTAPSLWRSSSELTTVYQR